MTFFRNRLFPLLAALLWCGFFVGDLFRLGDTTALKFAAICLCGLTALTRTRTRDGRLVAAALCLTVAADSFLLPSGRPITVGLALFVAVQLLYARRLARLRGKPSPPLAALRLLFAALALCLTALDPTRFPLWAALLYFSYLLLNTAEAFTLRKPRFGWGLALFVCCDVCVGLWNVAQCLPYALTELARVGMWLFYLPSQVLIVLSQE